MKLKLMGKKKGMTQRFDEQGFLVPCTLVAVEPNVIVQLKTKEKDGYVAIQSGFSEVVVKDPRTIAKRVHKPLIGHFAKNGIAPRRHLLESRVEDASGYKVGDTYGVEIFSEIKHVDASGITIGKGYQGGMKKHNFSGMRASHGTGPIHRHLGSTGIRIGWCPKGGKRASQMGNVKRTVQNVEVVAIDQERNVILLKGSIPGARNSLITLSAAVKK